MKILKLLPCLVLLAWVWLAVLELAGSKGCSVLPWQYSSPSRKAPEVGPAQLTMYFSWLFPWGASGFRSITPGWRSREAGGSQEALGPLFIQPRSEVSLLCQTSAQLA